MIVSLWYHSLLLFSRFNINGIFQYSETVSIQFSPKITKAQENGKNSKNSIFSKNNINLLNKNLLQKVVRVVLLFSVDDYLATLFLFL